MMSCAVRTLLVVVSLAWLDSAAHADNHDVLVDGGLAVSKPAALETGLSTGIGAGFERGGTLAWGASAAWSSATEHTTLFTVKHADLRLHAVGAVRRVAGRGTMSVRLGAGGTLVHETRTRDQGERAGLTGDDLEKSASRLIPSGSLEAAVTLRVHGAWGVAVRGGPTLNLRDGAAHAGWTGTLGVTWQP